ncbi:transcriptional regulator, TetR family [Blastococcus aurantiacus]|uniref:Transcriptional regulator, TetR family n=1 Tax=Blastococcus aurantiacus TaxID=1550231 RepID=A0A1G7RG81_9ACTN|nr:TetR/AcrR family transcriptional regulator [Blastococcus aurantiacus]SDG09778.1 transcriptional regulator, TetR family [Blastococcus aurantiacus]
MGGFRQQAEEQILDRAAALFARRGARTSLQEIADAVGLSKAGLQYHFPTKDSLHSAVLAKAAGIGQQVLDVVSDLPIGPERDLRAIEAWIDVALAHPGLVSLLLTPVSTAVTDEPADDGAEAVLASATAALAAFGVDPEAATAERTVRVAAALAALGVLTLAAHQKDLTVAWRPHMVVACFDALGHRRPVPTPEA